MLLYYPIHDMWMEPGKEMLVHVGGGHDVGITQAVAQELLDAGYTFDLVSDRQLAEATPDRTGVRTAGGGRPTKWCSCRIAGTCRWRRSASSSG